MEKVPYNLDADLSSPAAKASTAYIQAAILKEEERVRASSPLYARAHQSAVALLIWAASLAWMVLAGWLYLSGAVPWYFTFFSSAFASSLLHELEHDIIHSMYFLGAPIVWNVMFAGIWLAKLSLNPWTRKSYHLHHHRRSGQEDDVEERLLGLGVANFPLRVAVAVFPWLAAVFFFRDISRATRAVDAKFPLRFRGAPCSGERWLQRAENIMIISPTLALLVVCFGGAAAAAAARAFLVVWAGPNVLRHASIALMSSWSHYYAVTPGDVTMQNQILCSPVFWPLQVFCCNFGAEHIIHHYVVNQPFWVRHAVRHKAWEAMVAKGTRVNDLSSIFSRAQRYSLAAEPGKGAKGA
jgi:fatty acid desaturase